MLELAWYNISPGAAKQILDIFTFCKLPEIKSRNPNQIVEKYFDNSEIS
jgi:hypothetical protein